MKRSNERIWKANKNPPHTIWQEKRRENERNEKETGKDFSAVPPASCADTKFAHNLRKAQQSFPLILHKHTNTYTNKCKHTHTHRERERERGGGDKELGSKAYNRHNNYLLSKLYNSTISYFFFFKSNDDKRSDMSMEV